MLTNLLTYRLPVVEDLAHGAVEVGGEEATYHAAVDEGGVLDVAAEVVLRVEGAPIVN